MLSHEEKSDSTTRIFEKPRTHSAYIFCNDCDSKTMGAREKNASFLDSVELEECMLNFMLESMNFFVQNGNLLDLVFVQNEWHDLKVSIYAVIWETNKLRRHFLVLRNHRNVFKDQILLIHIGNIHKYFNDFPAANSQVLLTVQRILEN